MDWTAIAVISGLGVNAVAVGVGWGKMTEAMKNLRDDLASSKKELKENIGRTQEVLTERLQKVESEKHCPIPNDCPGVFQRLEGQIGTFSGEIKGLNGKVDILIQMKAQQ